MTRLPSPSSSSPRLHQPVLIHRTRRRPAHGTPRLGCGAGAPPAAAPACRFRARPPAEPLTRRARRIHLLAPAQPQRAGANQGRARTCAPAGCPGIGCEWLPLEQLHVHDAAEEPPWPFRAAVGDTSRRGPGRQFDIHRTQVIVSQRIGGMPQSATWSPGRARPGRGRSSAPSHSLARR